MVEEGKITASVAKEVFEKMAATGETAAAIVEAAGLGAMSGDDELTGIVQKVIAGNERAVADYRSGKEAAIKFLIGQVMRETRGRATPQSAQAILERELG